MFARFLSFKGRATRTTFWLGHIPLLLLYAMIAAYSQGLIPNVPPPNRADLLTVKVTLTKITKEQQRQNQIGFMKTFFSIIAILAIFHYVPWAVTTKRLHDRNRSGWWQILLYLVPLMVIAFIFLSELGLSIGVFSHSDMTGLIIFILLYMVSLVTSIWFLVELGFFGPRGGNPNKYGDAPPSK